MNALPMDKNAIIIVLGRLAQIVLTLASLRIFTGLLSVAEVGNLYLLNSIFGLVGLTFLNPVGMFMNRNIHRWTAERTILSHLSLFNVYLIVLSLLSVGLMFVLYNVMHIGAGLDLQFLLITVALFIFFNTWNTVIIPTLNLLDFQKSFVFFTLLTLLVSLVLSVLFSVLFKATALFWIAGQIVAQAVINLFAFLHFRKLVHSRADIRHMRSVLSKENLLNVVAFTMPLVITTFCMWLQNQSYRLIISRGIGADFLGILSLGLSIATQAASVVESIVQQLYYPEFYRDISTHDAPRRTAAWNALAVRSFPAYISLTVCISFLAPYLMRILADPKFDKASLFIVYGAWIELFRVTTFTLTSIAHAEMQTRYLLKSYFFGGLVSVLGVYFGMKSQHYEQLVPAMLLVGGIVTLLIMYYDMKKLMPFRIGIDRIVRALALSLPFSAVMLFYGSSEDLAISICLVLLAGLYFLATQFYLSFRSRPAAGGAT